MEKLTNQVITYLKDEGASIVGIAPVERFDGAPKGHHPCDFIPGAKSVITFGVALLNQVVHWERLLRDSEIVPPEYRKDVLQNYVYRQVGYNMVNELLDHMAIRTANFFEECGYISICFPATYGEGAKDFIQKRIPSIWGLFSQRHAAVMAGLGEFGLNNVVVTPQYGPRIRFNSVITEATLIPSPLLQEKTCLGESCSVCLESCRGAISLRNDFDPEAVWYTTPARTDVASCNKLRSANYCMGTCIKVCPVGLKKNKASQ